MDEAWKKRPDVLVCMQINDAAHAVSLKFGAAPQMKVVVFQSDGPITSPEVFATVDKIVIDASVLRFRLPFQFLGKTVHIPTPLEIDAQKFQPHTHPGRKLRLVYLGAQGNYFFAEGVINHLRSLNYDVTVLSDHPSADVPWNLNTYADELSKFDVGIVPYPENLQLAKDTSFTGFFYKDPSRPTLLQAIGLPVVVAPLPSYVEYIQHAETGLFANSIAEWMDRVEYLQSDAYTYNSIAASGYQQSWNYCRYEVVGQLWENVIRGISVPTKPKLEII